MSLAQNQKSPRISSGAHGKRIPLPDHAPHTHDDEIQFHYMSPVGHIVFIKIMYGNARFQQMLHRD